MAREEYGDAWLGVLGGLLVALLAFAWSLVVLVFRIGQWAYRRIKNRPTDKKAR